MIRLAARARSQGVAPIAAACFLHDARPTFAEALEGCVQRGATEVVLLPYALTIGPRDRAELLGLLAAVRALYPGLMAYLAEPLCDHAAIAHLVLQRAAEADYVAAHPFLAEHANHREDVAPALRPLYLPYPDAAHARREAPGQVWRPMYAVYATALLLATRGSVSARTGRPFFAVAEQIRRRRRYAAVRVCFIDEGRSDIGATLDDLIERGIRHALLVPCMLQTAAAYTPQIAQDIERARERNAALTLIQAETLGYDRRLVDALADRVAEAISQPSHLATVDASARSSPQPYSDVQTG